LDVNMCYAPTLVEAYLPTTEKVIRAVKEVLYH
jgi:pyruvate/2-oxoglutarate/acetoin dehydrogenase E1 component